VISFSNLSKSFFENLPFLQFCKKYDICNKQNSVSDCVLGKIHLIPAFTDGNFYQLPVSKPEVMS
jgi:hypothetical protein